MKPFEEQDIVEKLRNRAEIRRKIGRKADGKPDRIADTCEQAADEITYLRNRTPFQSCSTAWKAFSHLKEDMADEYDEESFFEGWYAALNSLSNVK